MQQLVIPNLDITYKGGWCEKAVENTVGQNGVYGSAYKAWNANVQHKENPPRGFYVPVYLSMPNGPKDPDGTQQGDVAISCPDGTVAAAAKAGVNRPLFKYPSLKAYISDYSKNNGGATLLGWGEYIGKVQVAKKGESMSKVTLDIARIEAYFIGGRNGIDGTKNALQGECDEDLIKNHVGRETNEDIWDWYNSSEGQTWKNIRLPKLVEEANQSEYIETKVYIKKEKK